MSFILDALKKSENDRQRQSGPALFEVRVPPPRSKVPLLAAAIVALLVVNVGVVTWLILRKPADAAPAATAGAVQPQVTQPDPNQFGQTVPGLPQTAPPPAGAAQAPGYPQGYPPPPAGYPTAPGAPPGANGAYPQPQAAPNGYPPANGQPDYSAPEPQLAESGNPDDYAPAQQPAPGFMSSRAMRGTESGLPTYEEAQTRTSLPPLHLDLHSYAADPTKRFVMVNMKRLYEGESLPEGAKVETITTDAAIMSYRGMRFVLNRD